MYYLFFKKKHFLNLLIGSNVHLFNLVFKNCYLAGIHVIDSHDVIIENCTTTNNTYGIVISESNVQILNSYITGNFAKVSGVGLHIINSVVDIRNSTISLNSGGVLAQSSNVQISFSNIISNVVASNGGGIYSLNSTLLVGRSFLRNNTATSKGGAIYMELSTFLITTCDISYNTEDAAIACYNSSGELRASEILRNKVRHTYEVGGWFSCYSNVSITSSVFSYNAGFAVVGYDNVLLHNTTISYTSGTALFGAASNLSLHSCTVANNTAQYYGAIYMIQLANISIFDSYIYNNTGPATIRSDESTTQVVDSIIHKNSTTGDGGGGVLVNYGSYFISNTTISYNSAQLGGGGVYFMSTSETVVNSTILENMAHDGGGFYIDSSPTSLLNVNVTGNSGQGLGGGLYVASTNVNISQSNIENNFAFSGGGIIVQIGSISVENSTLILNRAVFFGGGILAIQSPATSIKECNVSSCSLYYLIVFGLTCER